MAATLLWACSNDENDPLAGVIVNAQNSTLRLALPLNSDSGVEKIIVSGLWNGDTIVSFPSANGNKKDGVFICDVNVPQTSAMINDELLIGATTAEGNVYSFSKKYKETTKYDNGKATYLLFNESGRTALTGTNEGHKWVDVGLSFYIAAYNIGAEDNNHSTPKDYYGDYYAWGALMPDTSFVCDAMTDISGNVEHDVAAAEWKGKWSMLTLAQATEMMASTQYADTIGQGHKLQATWTKSYKGIEGLNGCLLENIYTGAKVFWPAAGAYHFGSYDYIGTSTIYWTSTPYDKESAKIYARHILWSNNIQKSEMVGARENRCPFRAVYPKY